MCLRAYPPVQKVTYSLHSPPKSWKNVKFWTLFSQKFYFQKQYYIIYIISWWILWYYVHVFVLICLDNTGKTPSNDSNDEDEASVKKICKTFIIESVWLWNKFSIMLNQYTNKAVFPWYNNLVMQFIVTSVHTDVRISGVLFNVKLYY